LATALIQKWGNSLALRIPKRLADQAGVSAGSKVEVTAVEHKIVIRPIKRRYRLKDLVQGITPENVHAEIDLAAAVGNEVW
jgi:antitoxin MazE